MLALFEKKPDHSMADIKSAHRLIDEIPKNDPLKALLELTSWIESVTAESDFHSDYQLSLLRLLDQAARTHEIRLSQEYFTVIAPQRLMENRLWHAMNEYYRQVSLACLALLKRYTNGDKGAAAIKPELPLITVRGIGALAGRLKFAVARYAPVEPAVWQQLAEFYSVAESLQYLDVPVPVQEAPNVNSSVRREFAAVLVWYASCAGTVTRLDSHLAHRLAMHLRACFTADTNCGPKSLFEFDVLQPAPPVRISSPRSPQTGRLFIVVEGVQESIEACFKSLEKNLVPEEFNLGGNYDADLVRNVLHRLSVNWTLPQQARRNARVKVKVNLKVVTGFSNVLEKVGYSGDSGIGGSAIWEADDISGGGFRAVLVPQDAKGLEVGSLIGVQPENVNHWGVGIVRRLSRDKQLNLHVGVALLSNRVQYIRLRGSNSDIEGEGQRALWFDGEDSGEASLLLQRHAFSNRRTWRARMGEKTALLTPLALLEETDDYELARYRIVEQETD